MIRHRRMTIDDLSLVLDWAAEEGWNPGLDDASAFLSADPAGFFLAEDDGLPVAAISVVNHGEAHAFLGLYLCRPDYRGRGIGYALWTEALAHAGERTVGLDGVPAQQENYVKSGFVHAGETARYGGPVQPRNSLGLAIATEADIPALVDREAAASGTPKPAYMSAWFGNTPTRRTLMLGPGGADGFATVRKCRTGVKIGPLVASDETAARALLHAAAEPFGGPVMIDVPLGSQPLAAICQSLGLEVSFRTARMYRGAPPAQASGLYAVGSLELG